MEQLSVYDTVIITLLLISVLIGWVRGAIKEVFTIISWGGSVFFTIRLFPIGHKIVRNFIQQSLFADLITYIFTFITFIFILSALSYFLTKLIRESVFNIPNKILGGIFGIIRGILVIVCINFGLTHYMFSSTSIPLFLQQSQLYPHIQNASQMIFLVLPNNVQHFLLRFLNTDKQKELINNLNNSIQNSTPNTSSGNSQVFAQLKRSMQKAYSNTDVTNNQSAEDLAKLNVKKNSTNDDEIFMKARKDLDKLLDQYIE